MLGVPGQWLQVAMTRRDTMEVIGDLGICVVDESASVVVLGFTVAHKAQGQGYATEAVRGIIETLLRQRQIRSVMAITDARNAASIALLRRVGFEHKDTTATMFRGEACQEDTYIFTAPLAGERNLLTL